jgi:hypothetical protein
MSITTYTTSRFVSRWFYLALLATIIVTLTLFFAPLFSTTLVNTKVSARVGQPALLPAISLRREPIGALRVDVTAQLPANQWVTYEIQLQDANKQIIASAYKEAWAESGTWSEDGETGSWYESDTRAGLDIRADRPEPIQIGLNLLEYTDTVGNDIDKLVPFNITVQNGVIDTRYLWAGWFGTTLLTGLAAISVLLSGRLAISRVVRDPEISARTELGGARKLVRVKVSIGGYTTQFSPPVCVNLFVKDANGEQIYATTQSVKLSGFNAEKGKTKRALASWHQFFVLEPQNSYGFYVQVKPEALVDRLTLEVRDQAQTLTPVEVNQISIL